MTNPGGGGESMTSAAPPATSGHEKGAYPAPERLAAVAELELITGGPFPVLDRLTALVADICDAELAAFTVHDATMAYQVSTNFGAGEVMPNTTCICSLAMDRPGTVVIADARAAGATPFRVVEQPPHLRSFAGVALGVDPGEVIGVLAIGHSEPGRFGEREVRRLQQAAELVSAFLAVRRRTVRAQRAAATTSAERARQVQFEMIFNAIGEGVIVFDAQGVTLEANPTAHAFVDMYDALTGAGRHIRLWPVLYPDGSPMPVPERPLARALHRGEAVRDELVMLPKPSGGYFWLSISAAPVVDAETGHVATVVATFSDVSARHLAETRLAEQNTQLADALAQAEKANRAKTDFMGVMSHELRTPMHAVLGCATLLGKTALDAGQARTLAVLEGAGRQMTALLNDLLDLSSLDADKVRIAREPVSLVRLIEDAAVIWSADVREKGLSLSVMIDPALVAPRDMDAGRLLQVIGNLMSNAIKFTSSGGVTLRAWPEGRSRGARRVAIEIEDTGPGVPQDAIERVFLPFEQADVLLRRRHGGLGLGLYVARRLAHALGGDIMLDSQEGEGARFVVTVDAPLSATAAPQLAGDAPTPETVLDILCVDDNPRNLFVLAALLQSAGHRTTVCESGREALDVMARTRFDVVLLDMVMPDMDGLEVLARMRADPRIDPATPVIACTANILADHMETYRQAGVAGVLPKPIDVRSLLQAVADVAGGRVDAGANAAGRA